MSLVSMTVPDMDITLNKPYFLDLGINVTFENTSGLNEYLGRFMSVNEKPDLIISSAIDVEILGTKCK